MTLSSLFQILGGVGLFLYGMKLMSDALQDLAGDRMRQLIAALTSTPIRGVAVGTLVTMLIQSSSATTVMVVSFVQAGLMELKQALAVMMGANVGTTITAQLVAFNIKAYALPVIGIGMILALFTRSKKTRYIGSGLLGFGLLFLGMSTMEGSMAFMRSRQDIFLAFAHHPILGVMAGLGLTMLVQSSSATVGLVIAMGAQGLLPLEAALPILLGDNLGTTITAVIASLGSSREAKQAAMGHVLDKLIGVLIFLPLLVPYQHLVSLTSSSLPRQIANAHTIFNVINTAILFNFIPLLSRFIQRILPSSGRLVYQGPQFLNVHLIDVSPAAAVSAVRSELLRMGHYVVDMLDTVHHAFLHHTDSDIEKLKQTEKIVNELNHAIANYSARLWHHHIAHDLSTLLASYVNGAGDLERIGDHCTNLIEMYEYLKEEKLVFSESALAEFEEMFGLIRDATSSAVLAVEQEDLTEANRVAGPLEDAIDGLEKRLRLSHIRRLNEGSCRPSAGIAFVDMVSNMERIGDHAHNLSMIVRDVARLSGLHTEAEISNRPEKDATVEKSLS